MGRARTVLAVVISLIALWQAAFVSPAPVAADDPLPPGYVDCGNGFVCGGGGSGPGGDPIVVTGPEDRIIQGTYLDDDSFVSPVSAWAYIENEAKAYIAAVHQVPVDSRLTDWARDELRAYILARLLEIAQNPANDVANPPTWAECSATSGAAQRTCQDQMAYHTLKVLTQRAKIDAAQNSVNEYNRWFNDPCSYDWPAVLSGAPSYQSRSDVIAYCTNPNIGLFTGAIPPSKEEFTAVGTAMEFADLATPEALQVTTDMTAAGGFLGALGGAAVAAAIAGAIVATVPAVSSLFVTGGALVIFPFAAYGSAAAAAGGAAAGVGAFTATLGIVSAVFIAVVGAVLAGIAIWQQVEQSKIILDLQKSLDEATDNAPDLAEMATSEDGTGFLGAVFQRETLPDYNDPINRVPGTPAHTTNDPDFIDVAHDVSGTLQDDPDSATITPRDWAGNAHTAYITDGWWSDQKVAATPHYATRLQYVDWNGQNRYAGVAGNTFIHSKPDGSDSSVSPTIQYLDSSGVKRTATLHRNEPPTLAPTVEGNFKEGQPLTFHANASDPEGGEVTVTWRIEDPRGQLIDFIVNGESTLQKCYTNPLNQGAVPGELFFGCPWPTHTGQTTQFTYVDSGVWHVNVVATDDHGISRNTVFQVEVANLQADLWVNDWTEPTIDEGSEVSFDGGALDIGDDPLRIKVDWGDGTVDNQYFPCDWAAQVTIVDSVVVFPPNYCLATPNALDDQLRVKGAADPSNFSFSHTYADNPPSGSEWPITITAFDDDGGVSTLTKSATVNNVAPNLQLHCARTSPPGLIDINPFQCEDRFGDTNYAVPLTGVFDDPGLLDEFKLSVDWGDGNSEEFDYPCADDDPCPFQTESNMYLFLELPGRVFFRPTHVYSQPGTYSIGVTLADGDEGSDSETASAVISAAPEPEDETDPTISIETPFDGATYVEGQAVHADYACADETALESCVGSVADGELLDTRPGTHTFSVTATDVAGNTASQSVTYHALYDFDFMPSLVTRPAVNERVAGKRVRIRFTLHGPHGIKVTRGLARQARADCGSGERLSRWTTARLTKLAYNKKKDFYYFDFKTRAKWAGKCRAILVRLKDGTNQELLFHFSSASAAAADVWRR